jgi:hypothetical protein
VIPRTRLISPISGNLTVGNPPGRAETAQLTENPVSREPIRLTIDLGGTSQERLNAVIVFTSESCCLVNAMLKHLCFGLFALLLSTSVVRAQDVSVAQARSDGSVRFLVAVTTKSGEPVTDLQKQYFTVFDGDVIRPIRSFRAVSAQNGQHVFMTVTLGMPTDTFSAVDTSPIYEVIFDGARSRGQRQFHEVGIKVDRPNLKIATSAGYLTAAY